jgi:hypothetical protein
MLQSLSEHSAAPTDLSAATDERDRPLPVAGFKGTHEEIERQWYEEVYRGRGDSMAQLTWRAVLIGSCLGAVLSLTNLYIGLKAGWGFGVAITVRTLVEVLVSGDTAASAAPPSVARTETPLTFTRSLPILAKHLPFGRGAPGRRHPSKAVQAHRGETTSFAMVRMCPRIPNHVRLFVFGGADRTPTVEHRLYKGILLAAASGRRIRSGGGASS